MAAFSTENIVNRYIPFAGGASALAFSVNVMQPALFHRLLAPNDLAVSNCLWITSHVGTGVRLYQSQHLRRAGKGKRIIFSAFGSMLFNFGSVLFWATTKKLLPKCRTVQILFGVGSGVSLLVLGEMYLREIDSNVSVTEEEK